MEKQRWEESKKRGEEGEKIREENESEERRCRWAKKLEKNVSLCLFHWLFGSGGSKSWRAKTAGAETSGQMRDEKLHAVVARSTFPRF
jgi:hypothetical protein